MKTRVIKIGNSRGVILPSSVIKTLSIEEKEEVHIEYDEVNQNIKLSFPRSRQLKLG